MTRVREISRWNIQHKSKLWLEGAERCVDCVCSDISFRGAKVFLPLLLPRDRLLKIKFCLSEDCEFSAEVWVAWHRYVGGANLYGFYFNKVKDADKEKIYAFIHRNYPQKITAVWWERPEEKPKEGPMQDRRIFERFRVSLPLRILEARSSREMTGAIENIGAKGLRALMTEQLSPGAELELWIELERGKEPMYARGEVVWTMEKPGKNYCSGICLEKAFLHPGVCIEKWAGK